jgi:predicted ATP-binding protein involved in virulence
LPFGYEGGYMKLKSLKLKDFRPFHQVKTIQDGNKEREETIETEIHFSNLESNDKSNLTVFIGENGSGKTAILDALAILFTELAKTNYSYEREDGKIENVKLFDLDQKEFMDKKNGYFLNESDLYLEEKENERKVYPATIEIELENEDKTYFWRVDGHLNEFKKFNQNLSTIDFKKEVSFSDETELPSYKDLIAYLKYNLRKDPNYNFPFFCYYQVDGSIREGEKDSEDNKFNLEFPQLNSLQYAFTKEDYSLWEFTRWFIAKERDENRKIKSKNDLTYRDSNIQLVRYVLNQLSSCLGLGIDEIQEDPSDQTRIVFQKNKNYYHFSQLSAGEKRLLFLFLDIAKRICIANPGLLELSPQEILKQANGVVIIDEIDLHLHPKWQRMIIPTLCDTFPGVQFIVTTHSALVVGEVEHNSIRLLEKNNIAIPEGSYGWRYEKLVRKLMVEETRGTVTLQKIQHLWNLIKSDLYESGEFINLYNELENNLTAEDEDLMAIRIEVSRRKFDKRKKENANNQ